jgi:hypothetical protein
MASTINNQQENVISRTETPEPAISLDQSVSLDKTAAGSVLSRKLRKLVDSSLETDVETQEALRELSTFFGENTLKNRRQLRGEIERRSLQINSDFLDGFCHVKDALDQVYEEAKAMNDSCLAMQAQLKASKSRTQDLISQTTAMQNQSAILAQKASQIQQFSEKYQLKPEEELLLRGSNKDLYALSDALPVTRTTTSQSISVEFFAALEKAQKIHFDCRKLLSSGHLNKQTTALEVLDQMSRLQESGLQRLYRWTQSTVRTAYNLDSAGASSRVNYSPNKDTKTSNNPAHLLPIAMKHLAVSRPALFRLVIDEFCTARRSLLVKAFLDALTIGGPYGTPKPIELHAHDPLRYVGDMLAWLHQAVPTEADNLKALLRDITEDLCLEENVPDNSMNKNNGSKVQMFGKEKCIDSSLHHITEGACRPMRSRVEQILASESAPLVLYKLANLIRFYASTIGNILGMSLKYEINVSTDESTGLIATLKDLDEMAYKQFISVLQATVHHHTGIDGGLSSTGIEISNSGDLSPSHSTTALLSLLRETLSSTSVMEEQRDQLEQIVQTVVQPLLSAVNSTAASFPTTDQDVYLLNSLYQVNMTLSLFKFNDARLSSLESEMQLHLDTLSSEQTSSLIANLGIQPMCTMLAQAKTGGTDSAANMNGTGSGPVPLSQVSGMDNDSLKRFMAGFDQFLVAPDAFMLPQIRLLASSSHRKSVAKRSLQVVSATYKQLYDAITDSFNG